MVCRLALIDYYFDQLLILLSLEHRFGVGARQIEQGIQKVREPEGQIAEIPCQTVPDIFPEEKAKCHWNFWESHWQIRRWSVFGEQTRGNSDERQGLFTRIGVERIWQGSRILALFYAREKLYLITVA